MLLGGGNSLVYSHPPFSDVQCELDHDNEVKCMDLDDDVSKVASGTIDGETCVSFIPSSKCPGMICV